MCLLQGDVSRCREAKGAVLAFVIIFNTVTQSESTLLKIPLRYLQTYSYRSIHSFRRLLFRVAFLWSREGRTFTLCSKLFPKNGKKIGNHST